MYTIVYKTKLHLVFFGLLDFMYDMYEMFIFSHSNSEDIYSTFHKTYYSNSALQTPHWESQRQKW